MRCLVRCLMYVIYVTAVPRGSNQDGVLNADTATEITISTLAD